MKCVKPGTTLHNKLQSVQNYIYLYKIYYRQVYSQIYIIHFINHYNNSGGSDSMNSTGNRKSNARVTNANKIIQVIITINHSLFTPM